MKYIIIGAMDGISFDNIFDKLTIDDIALFVEPIPHQFKKLQENVDKLPCKVYLENSVVSDRVENIVMAYLPDAQDFLGGCSSVVKFGIPLNRYLAKIDNLTYHEATSVTFDMLCEKYGFTEVDYVQVDCEGYDQIIVDSIDLEKYNIKKLKFEIHYIDKDFVEYFSNKWKSYNPTTIQADIIYEHTI